MGTSVRDGAPRRLTHAPEQSAAQTAFRFSVCDDRVCSVPPWAALNFGTRVPGNLGGDGFNLPNSHT